MPDVTLSTNMDEFLTGVNPTTTGIAAADAAVAAAAAADVEALAGRDPSVLSKLISSDDSTYSYSLNTIPASYASTKATAIGLAGAANLKGFEIGSTVTSIGANAFQGVTLHTAPIVIPNGVTSISNYAFFGCSGSTKLIFGKSLTTIGDGVFGNCSNLAGDVTIPDGVTSIGSYAFYFCGSIGPNLTLPSSLSYISFGTFASCGTLTDVYCYTTRDAVDQPNAWAFGGSLTFHVRASDNTWTAGPDSLGATAVTVIKDL
jgi:hypothetical protein